VQLPHLTFQTVATGALSYMDSAGDPVVGFGPNNTVYYGNIVFSRAAPAPRGTEAASGNVINVSHDGPCIWGEPVIIRLDDVDATGNPTATNIFKDKIWLLRSVLLQRAPRRRPAGRFPWWHHALLAGLQPAGQPQRHSVCRVRGHRMRNRSARKR
jgi:hypothetical protein